MAPLGLIATFALLAAVGHGRAFDSKEKGRPFNVEGHRGARGEAIENTLPAFAWALIDGVTTLELDNGLTKDGAVVVWHDEVISSEKCKDTSPVVANDPDFPYVGKSVANLTLSQIKTLDCGSQRLSAYPLQLTYPGLKISTMNEVFDFVRCVDSKREVAWNIESKLNPVVPGATRSVEDFVQAQHAAFASSGYSRSKITYQSFDWRSIIAMKKRDPRILTSALIQRSTSGAAGDGTFPWLAGLNLDSFPGETLEARIAQAAKSIKADVLSPNAGSLASPFTTKEMVDEAHKLGLTVVPWTVNELNVAEALLDLGVDGIISDYPVMVRRLVEQHGRTVAAQHSKDNVMRCLNRHIQRA